MPKGNPIIGRLVPFPDGRMVFLARHPEATYLAFKSVEGQDTKIKLSNEAFNALIEMATTEHVGTPERDFPLAEEVLRWRVVEHQK